MKSLRITPINVVLAALLTWVVWQIIDDKLLLSRILWLLLLFIVLVVADQIFRVLIKNISKIWLIEGVFIVLVVAVLWILSSW